MKLFNKIKKLYKDILKPKCSKCKSVQIYSDEAVFKENRDIKKMQTEYSEPIIFDKYNAHNPMTSRYERHTVIGYYDWVENTDIYEIKYHCKKCSHSWNEEEHKVKKKSEKIYTSCT